MLASTVRKAASWARRRKVRGASKVLLYLGACCFSSHVRIRNVLYRCRDYICQTHVAKELRLLGPLRAEIRFVGRTHGDERIVPKSAVTIKCRGHLELVVGELRRPGNRPL